MSRHNVAQHGSCHIFRESTIFFSFCVCNITNQFTSFSHKYNANVFSMYINPIYLNMCFLKLDVSAFSVILHCIIFEFKSRFFLKKKLKNRNYTFAKKFCCKKKQQKLNVEKSTDFIKYIRF